VKKGFADTFVTITSLAYLLLGVSCLTTAATAPIWLILLATDLSQTWPALLLAAPLAGPATYAAFACFADHTDGGLKVVSVYLRAWREGVRRAGPLGLAVTALVAVVVVDVIGLAGSPAGALAAPVLAMTGACGLASFFIAVAAAQEFAALRRLALIKASLYCAIRHGGWSLISLAALALWVAFLSRGAIWSLAAVLGPVLYLVWANSRHSLTPVRATIALAPPPPAPKPDLN
jgi:hypothetical protein